MKIETNYPDVLSIVMPRDVNGTYGAHQRFVLQVCVASRNPSFKLFLYCVCVVSVCVCVVCVQGG